MSPFAPRYSIPKSLFNYPQNYLIWYLNNEELKHFLVSFGSHPSTHQEIPQHKGYPSYLDHCSDISPINPTFNYMFLTCAVQYTVTFSCILPVTLYLSSRSTILTSTSTIVLTHFPLSPVKRSTFKQPILFSVLSHQAPGKHNISNNKIIPQLFNSFWILRPFPSFFDSFGNNSLLKIQKYSFW